MQKEHSLFVITCWPPAQPKAKNMKYFIGQLEETNGEYEHYITVRFTLENKANPSDALENVARSWYDSDVEEQDDRYFFFQGELCVRSHGCKEISETVYREIGGYVAEALFRE